MTDWGELWRTLATAERSAGDGEAQMVNRWQAVAARLDSGSGYPDPMLDFLLSRLDPSWTLLDVGAGVGRWAVPLAKRVRSVTAVEPSTAMREMLERRARDNGLGNLATVGAAWPDAKSPVHDVAIAVFSMYGAPDLVGFVRAMEACARRACYLAMRVPAHDGVIGELSERIHGCWHDSPNFIVGYNLLLAAGFYPSVFMEPRPVRFWTDSSIEQAISRAKRHLRLSGTEHDELIRGTLEKRLVPEGEGFRWTDVMRSALIYWDRPL